MARRPGQSLLAGNIMPGCNITPSNHPYPLTGQRVVRGLLLLVLLAMAVTTMVLMVWLGTAIAGRPARIAPAIARADGGHLVLGVADLDALSFASRFVAIAENWSAGTVADQPAKLRNRLHPTLYQTFDDNYKKIAATAQQFSQSHAAVPIAGIIGGRDNGVIRMAIKFDVIELTGKDGKREVTADSGKLAIISIVEDTKTDDNPDGLLVATYVIGTVNEWLKAGKPKFWKN